MVVLGQARYPGTLFSTGCAGAPAAAVDRGRGFGNLPSRPVCGDVVLGGLTPYAFPTRGTRVEPQSLISTPCNHVLPKRRKR